MAYFTQEMKKEKAPAIKAVLKKFGMKGSIGVKHYSTLVVNISKGIIDFKLQEQDRGYIQVNHYYIKEHYQDKAAQFLTELYDVMYAGNYNNSDIMTDYFDVGFYIDINIGKWDKPYILIEE